MTDNLKYIQTQEIVDCAYWPGQHVRQQLSAIIGSWALNQQQIGTPGFSAPAARRATRMEGVKKGYLSMSFGSVAPLCPSCRACVPLRVNVEEFSLSTTQKKLMRDGRYHYELMDDIDKKQMFGLFQRYTNHRHREKESTMAKWSRDDFDGWIEYAPVILAAYNKQSGRMAGFAALEADHEAAILEYVVYDPVYADDSVGKRMWLATMIQARAAELSHVYVGAWAKNSPKLDYKKNHTGLETFTGTEWVKFNPQIHVRGPDYAAMIAKEKLTLL